MSRCQDYVPEEFLDKLPQFAINIFQSKYIQPIEKQKVWGGFLERYLTDNEYRRECQGKMVLFLYFEYYGICEEEEISEIDAPGNEKFCFLIVDNPKEKFLLYSYQHTFTVGTVGDRILPRTEIMFHVNGKSFSENRLVDTGASYTTIPFLEKWDHELRGYSGRERGRYGFDYSGLNDNIKLIVNINLHTGSAQNDPFLMLNWKEPLVLSINNLPPISLKQTLIPKPGMNTCVIGIDVLYYHTLIVSSENSIINFKFLPGPLHDSENIPVFVDKEPSFLRKLGLLERSHVKLRFYTSSTERKFIVCLPGYKVQDSSYNLKTTFYSDSIYDTNKINVLYYTLNKNSSVQVKVLKENYNEKECLRELLPNCNDVYEEIYDFFFTTFEIDTILSQEV